MKLVDKKLQYNQEKYRNKLISYFFTIQKELCAVRENVLKDTFKYETS